MKVINKSLNRHQYNNLSLDATSIGIFRLIRHRYYHELLFFCGANARLLLFRSNSKSLIVDDSVLAPTVSSESGALFVISGEKRGIGNSKVLADPFVRHQIDFEEGDQIFLPTDGFYSHFFALNEKDNIRKRLDDLLASLCLLEAPTERKLLIAQYLKESNGKSIQLDDITLIGVEL